jgi:hypothetical protein
VASTCARHVGWLALACFSVVGWRMTLALLSEQEEWVVAIVDWISIALITIKETIGRKDGVKHDTLLWCMPAC